MTFKPWRLAVVRVSIRLSLMAENEESIGRRIAELRKAADLTQEELAGRAGMAPENLSRAERGQTMPHLSKLIGIANALGVSLDDLAQGRGATLQQGAKVVRLIRRIEGLDEETAEQVAKVLNVLLDVLEEKQ